MAITVKELPSGSSFAVGPEGRTAVRTFLVRGISGANIQTRLKLGLEASGIPRYGDPHPSDPTLYVRSVESAPFVEDRTTIARVTANYSVPSFESAPADAPEFGTRQISSSVSSARTEFDRNGNALMVSHRFQTEDASGNPVIETDYQHAQVDVFVPQVVVTYSRRESNPPFNAARRYVGCVNRTPWLGEPARSWLCTRVDGTSDDGGQTYNVTYEFQLNFDTWDAKVVYNDPDTNAPPVNQTTGESTLVQGEGIRKYRVYDEVDFSDLGVNF